MVRLALLGMLALAAAICFAVAVAFAGARRERTGLWMIVLTIPVALFVLSPGRSP